MFRSCIYQGVWVDVPISSNNGPKAFQGYSAGRMGRACWPPVEDEEYYKIPVKPVGGRPGGVPRLPKEAIFHFGRGLASEMDHVPCLVIPTAGSLRAGDYPSLSCKSTASCRHVRMPVAMTTSLGSCRWRDRYCYTGLPFAQSCVPCHLSSSPHTTSPVPFAQDDRGYPYFAGKEVPPFPAAATGHLSSPR